MKLKDLLPFLPTYQKRYRDHDKGDLFSTIFIDVATEGSNMQRLRYKIPPQYLDYNIVSMNINGSYYYRWYMYLVIEKPIEVCYDKETGGNK